MGTFFVIGDLHGRSNAFEEVLEKSNFDRARDTLISLGDICDGGPDTKECFEILETIKNKIIIISNHDTWAIDWMLTGNELPVWVHQGGHATMESYGFDRDNVPHAHVEMLRNAKIYHIDSLNNIYVHGGINPRIPIEKQSPDFITWDRDLVKYAHKETMRKKSVNIKPYNHVFCGHTSTQFFKETRPLFLGNVIMLDTGAGHMGKLTIMNVNTLDYWQSEKQGSCIKNFTFGGNK